LSINNFLLEIRRKLFLIKASLAYNIHVLIHKYNYHFYRTNFFINLDNVIVLYLQILHVGGQVDIMRQAIMDVHTNDKLGTSLTVLRDLIHRHRKIITLSNDIETLFSFIALLQLLWNTLIICFCGFMIILVRNVNCFDLLIDNLLSFAGC